MTDSPQTRATEPPDEKPTRASSPLKVSWLTRSRTRWDLLSPSTRKAVIAGGVVALCLAVFAIMAGRGDKPTTQAGGMADASEDGGGGEVAGGEIRSPSEAFAAAVKHWAKSGGDAIRLDDFQATDDHFLLLAQFERLRVIRVDGGQLTPVGARALATMPHLEQLHLRGIAVDDATLDEIAKSPRLWLLNIVDAKVSAEAVARLALMPKLRQLRLGVAGGGHEYADAVASVERLRTVHLIGIAVRNSGLKRLAEMPVLESLYLDDCAVTDEGWEWLFENKTHLHVHIDQKHHDRDPQKH